MKFETVETVMCQYLMDKEMERLIDLKSHKTDLYKLELYEEANSIEESIESSKQKLEILSKLLEESELSTVNKPHYIEISSFDRFAKKTVDGDINCFPLDDEAFDFYYTNSGIKLKDWSLLEEGKEYIVGNLTFRKLAGELLSKYPQEEMWYEVSDEIEKKDSGSFLQKILEENFYIKH